MDDNLTTMLSEQLALGHVSIEDNALTFRGEGFPKIEKLILDEGYEDPVRVQFSPTSPVVEFPIDIFSTGGASLGEFLRGLLSEDFKLEEKELAGASLYTVRIGSHAFSSIYRQGFVTHFIPISLIRALGHSKKN